MEEDITPVPRWAYESAVDQLKWEHQANMARAERANHRWFIIALVLLLLLFGTNAGWLAYESQFTDEIVTQEVWQDVDTRHGSAIVSGIGEIKNAESETAHQDDDPQAGP